MLAKIISGAVNGLSAVPVTVEVDIASQGLPSCTIVGLPDKAVDESRERVRAAIKNSGAEFPAKRITINLAPADLPKIGPAYDLPIALGILLASGQLVGDISDTLFFGELSLDGSVRHTNGMLSMTLLAKEQGWKRIFIPSVDAREASVVSGVTVYPVPSLLALFSHLRGGTALSASPHIPFSDIQNTQSFDFDLSDISGQEQVKRVLEIGAAGGHNIFMQGPPGAGKTLLARTLPSIMPQLTEQEALEVTKIYSVTGNLPAGESVMKYRPFRSPHHTTSRIGLVGGGTHPMPGEISLAHRGVLFLDEFPEFPRHVLEALRQPMEDGVVSISRAAGSVIYPSTFMLIAAANPCPCGNLGSPTKRCICPPGVAARYRRKISGPIMDRIDLHVHVPPVATEKLTDMTSKSESSSSVRMRVQQARNRQWKRLRHTKYSTNADLSNRAVRQYCQMTEESAALLRQAVNTLGLSARSYYRMIKVAQTITDLAGERIIGLPHIAEALQYRSEESAI